MARLSSVPGWVRPSLRAVADVEHYLLRLYGLTESPEALAGFSSLTWLGDPAGESTPGPLVWHAPPAQRFADAFMAVADAIAEGRPYPPPEWWQEHAGSLGPMTREQWVERACSWPQRYFAHGVACALGWAAGVFDDPAILAPIHRGDGAPIVYSEREEYRVRLRGLAIPPELPREQLRVWLTDGPAALDHRPGGAAGALGGQARPVAGW